MLYKNDTNGVASLELYVHLFFNSSFEIEFILIMFTFNKEPFLNHSICQDVFIIAKYL